MHRTLIALCLVTVAACGPSFATDSLDGATADEADLRHRRDAGMPFDPCAMLSLRSSPLITFAAPQVAEVPFVDALNAAQQSIRVMVYQLTSAPIREALRAKAAAGVEVHVILDQGQKSTNQTSFDVLSAAGAQVQWSDPGFAYTHAKFMVVDEAVALISTGNYDSYMHSGRNFGAVDKDAFDVKTLVTLFDADRAHQVPDLSCTRLIISPANARARHLELLKAAQQTLTIESMQFSDGQVRQAVLERQQAGVAVRVLLAAPSWVSANASAGAWLKAHGVLARWRSSPSVHVKTFVIDGKTAFFGSENLSSTSLDKNREVGLATTEADALQLISSTFESDWATATAF